jgi:hypothetical protein
MPPVPPGAPRVAFVTCAPVPDLDPDDRLAAEALEAAGIRVEPAVWDDPTVDWTAHDLTVLRSTWDYAERRDDFVTWAAAVPRLANPADVVAWNTDKTYLRELAAAGLPVVPTRWLEPGRPHRLPDRGEWVLKPSVSCGSRDTGRYDLASPEHRRLAARLLDRLLAAGRTVMLQPYLRAVDAAGETAVIHLGGRLSHAVRKAALLHGPHLGDNALYLTEQIDPRPATAAERAVAERVLAAVPGGPDRLLYARVDLIPAPDGTPTLLELELTEPSLFLSHAPGAPRRLADAIARTLGAAAS